MDVGRSRRDEGTGGEVQGLGDVNEMQREREPETRPVRSGHHHSYGGDTMPKTPLDNDKAATLFALGTLIMFSGVGMLGLGVVINTIVKFRGVRDGPQIWWMGIPTFLLGIAVMYASVKRKRKLTYIWSTVLLVAVFTQVTMMGIVGNFTTSHYDIYPLITFVKGHPMCAAFWDRCYCQDQFNGAYSSFNLPGVHYIPDGDIRWRETRYSSCNDVRLISRVYFAFMGCLAVYVLCAVMAFCVGYAATICARFDNRFQKLVEEAGPDLEEAADHDELRQSPPEAATSSRNDFTRTQLDEHEDTVHIEYASGPNRMLLKFDDLAIHSGQDGQR